MIHLDQLNFSHLRYFHVVAREGSVTRASEVLHLTQPTLSGQIRKLERALGEKLFARSGRNLVLTDVGRLVYSYSEEIFALGRQMLADLEGRPTGKPLRLNVGLVDAMPKLIAYRLLQPAMAADGPVHVVCREGKLEDLVSRLAVHGFDLVLSDVPVDPQVRVKAFNHLLGECGVTVFAVAELADRFREGFPASLADAPFVLPTEETALRRSLERWFEKAAITPQVVGELEDGALLKAFGHAGVGLFAAPSAIEEEVVRQYQVEIVGRLPEVTERFYAITVERRLKHPAVVELSRAARDDLLAPE